MKKTDNAPVETGAEEKTEGQAVTSPEVQAPAESAARAEGNGAPERTQVYLRHKTPYPQYRRACFALTRRDAPYEVTAAQLAILQADPLVAVTVPKEAAK